MTFLNVTDEGDIFQRVEAQLESWLRTQKKWDPPTESTGLHVGPEGMELLVLHRQTRDGRSFRARLIEPTSRGTWRSTLTLHSSPNDDPWIGVRVSNSLGRTPAVPKLVTYLLDALEARDGGTWLSSKPRLISSSHVEDFAAEICHLDRQGLAFVAGTNEELDFGAFARQVERWTLDVRGLAQVAILDPSATSAFNEIMGRRHEVDPWTIRTFLPDVDPAIDSDGRRHRTLGTGRLADETDQSIRNLLGRIARRHAAEQSRPVRFTVVDNALRRMEDALVIGQLTSSQDSTPSNPPVDALPSNDVTLHAATVPLQMDRGVADAADTLGRLKDLLGVDDFSSTTLESLARRLEANHASEQALARVTEVMDDRRRQIEDLSLSVDFYKELTEDNELELVTVQETISQLGDEVRWLRGRLAQLEDFDAAYSPVPADQRTDYPESFASLLEALPGMADRGVIFTGDAKITRSLDEHDLLGRLVAVAWDGFLSLADYVRARENGDCSQGIKYFMEHPPPGYRVVPPKKFAENETAQTMSAWGAERILPVPGEYREDQCAPMKAHFKLGKVGKVSPRMYFLDAWSTTGQIYVGYIGDHMRNTRTN